MTDTVTQVDLMTAEEKSTSVAKCPNCGANTTFSPEEQTLKCEHCGTVINFDQSERAEEISLENMMAEAGGWDDETHVFQCNNCGAKEILQKNEIAKECSYCGTTNIVEIHELAGLKPNAVIPFKITKEKASERYLGWVKKKFFTPKIFKKHANPEELKGVYNPGFTFDAQTFSSYRGTLGKYYYKTVRGSDGKPRQVRETRYFNVSGVYSDAFNDILIQASKQLNQKTLDELAPWNTDGSNKYSENFLHGFVANSNDKEGAVCWQEARRVIDSQIKRRILAKYTYDVVQSFSVNTQCNNVTYKYVMLPVYVGHCSWSQKIYNFFVNGFSGKVSGKTPISKLKVALVVGIGLVALAGIGLAAYFLGVFD